MADFLDTKIHTFWGKYINKQHPDHYYFCSASFGTWILKALFFTGVSVPQALQAQDSNPSPIPKWRLHQPFSPKHVYFHIPLTRRILGSVRNRTWETVQATKRLFLLPLNLAGGKTFTSLDNCMPMAYSCCPNKRCFSYFCPRFSTLL